MRPSFEVAGEWDELFAGAPLRDFEAFLPAYLATRRWFAQKARTITAATVVDFVPLLAVPGRRSDPVAFLVVVQAQLDHGSPERYSLPLAFATGEKAEELNKWHAEAVLADVTADGEQGVLYDALFEPAFTKLMVELLARRRSVGGNGGKLLGIPSPSLRQFDEFLAEDYTPVPLSAEQSNSSVLLGNNAIMKFIRRFEEGVNPGVEVGRFLSERARFAYAPLSGGSVEYRPDGPGSVPTTVAVLEEFISNEDDGWNYVVDALTHSLEEALAHRQDVELRLAPPRSLFALDRSELEPGHLLVGAHLEWASLLGKRTAELHQALTSDHRDPDFAPEPLTALDRQALYHGARSLTRKVFHDARSLPDRSPRLEQVLVRENEIIDRMRKLSMLSMEAERIRCHGDYHLGQVLWTGKDFVIIDFEGEPSRSLGRRRLKRPAVVDLAGMVRSFHYAGRTAAQRLTRDLGTSMASVDRTTIDTWLTFWHRWISGTFLDAYLEVAGQAEYLPHDLGQLTQLFDFFLLEKAIYELGYETNSRPDWVDIPARGILDILDLGS